MGITIYFTLELALGKEIENLIATIKQLELPIILLY